MAQYNTTSTLDGLFKAVYGEGPLNLIPEQAVISKMIKFRESERIGKSYQVPTILSSEHGVTYLAAGDGVTTLEDAVAATLKNAEVNGAQIVLRGQIDYEAAAKASSSKVAFKNSTELLVENLMDSAMKRQEIAFLYGGQGLGVGDTSVNTDATHTVMQLTLASWASGIWAGMGGAKLHMYKTSDATLVSSGADAVFVIDSVDHDNRKLTLSGTATGIAALDTHLSSGNVDIYFKGAKAKECDGIDKIITNSGSLFGISAATYDLWAGSSYSAGSAALTMAKVLSAVSKAVAKGGLNEDVVCLVNPVTWNNLNSDQSALRDYDASYKKESENGFEAITYRGNNGKISVVAHSCVKQGEAFIFPPKRVKRVGAQEISFQTPGRKDEIFLHLPDKNAYELRLYANQSLFIETPAKCVKITAIVNS